MKALVDQLPALLGVALGAVGAMASSGLTDRLRWRRDNAVRWDQRRLDAYVDFTATLKDTVRVCFRLTVQHRYGDKAVQMDHAAALEVLDVAEADNSRQWEILLLLGDAATVEAARRWRDAVRSLKLLATHSSWDRTEWDSAVHRVDRARDEFHAAARRGIGVAGRSVEQFSFQRNLHGDLPSQ